MLITICKISIIFNIVEEWNNVVIVIVKHYFLNLCIISFLKTSVKKNRLQKNKENNNKNGINKPKIIQISQGQSNKYSKCKK